MKKYIFICLLCMQSVMMLSMEIKRTKKREIISRAIVQSYQNKKTALNSSQPIPIAGSGDFEEQEPQSIAELFRSGSSNSLSDQGRSPNFRDCVT